MIRTWYFLIFLFLNPAFLSARDPTPHKTAAIFSHSNTLSQSQQNGLSAKPLPFHYTSNQHRTKEYEQATTQQLAFEQARSNYIFKKSQEPRCALQLSDGSYLGLVLNRWKNALKNAQNLGDVELVARLAKRVEVLSKTRISSTRSVYNSDLESLLVYEFKDSYTSVKNLAQKHPQNIHAKMALSVLIECADLVSQELDVGAAFSHADFAHDLVTLVQESIKGGVAIARGAYHGAKTACSLEHWKQMAHGMLHLVKVACKKGLELVDVVTALDSGNKFHCDKILSIFEQRGAAEYAALQDHLKKSWHTIQKKSWDQLLESGVEVGALMLLDTIMMNGAGYAATAAGRFFVSEVATIFKQGGAAREAYCAEVAGVGKLVIEDESATLAALKELEKHPDLVVKNDVSMAEGLAEEIKLTRAQKHMNDLQNLIRSEELLIGKEVVAKNKIEQLQYFDKFHKKAIFVEETSLGTVIYKTPGGYQEAFVDFNNLKLLGIKPLPEKEGFLGFMYDGRTIITRLESKDIRPTLEIQEKVGKNTLYTKYRYGEK